MMSYTDIVAVFECTSEDAHELAQEWLDAIEDECEAYQAWCRVCDGLSRVAA